MVDNEVISDIRRAASKLNQNSLSKTEYKKVEMTMHERIMSGMLFTDMSEGMPRNDCNGGTSHSFVYSGGKR